MAQGPTLETNRFSASQEISHILWYPKVHYRIHKSPPPVPMLNQMKKRRVCVLSGKYILRIKLSGDLECTCALFSYVTPKCDNIISE
jgi:hypothetical protein